MIEKALNILLSMLLGVIIGIWANNSLFGDSKEDELKTFEECNDVLMIHLDNELKEIDKEFKNDKNISDKIGHHTITL